MVACITTHDAITDKAFEQDWALDATGNWCDVDDDGDKSRRAVRATARSR